ncbi:unnamed protein product [Rotaria magnacalcarata]|uniref:Uncharacterized protein n=2 Tax=Rotaria magnacalcarata TaxID=392030 RepID=A0A819A5C0_9BILA|nr:unnamed protein product [Rotaria magnacalcarata]CAF3864797.1 unnamed protein product [Rotaria magnacalcarata]
MFTTLDVSNAIVYSQSFTYFTTPSSQCTDWTTFRALLVGSSYTSLTISGTNDPTGITLTNAVYVNAIAQALRTYSSYGPVSSNSYSWAVGGCGGGPELTATGCVCCCNTGYTVRPCIGNYNWGGVNCYTCTAAGQTLTVTIMFRDIPFRSTDKKAPQMKFSTKPYHGVLKAPFTNLKLPSKRLKPNPRNSSRTLYTGSSVLDTIKAEFRNTPNMIHFRFHIIYNERKKQLIFLLEIQLNYSLPLPSQTPNVTTAIPH